MTQEEIQQLDQDLAKEEEKIRHEIQQMAIMNPSASGTAEENYSVRVPQISDSSDEDQYSHSVADLDRNFAITQELENKLKDIQRTRHKIKGQKYGICEKCLKEIQPARLKAVPVAALCVSCANEIK